MKIDYVIIGSDENPNYLDFWPIVSKIWKQVFKITPVLGLICEENSDIFSAIGLSVMPFISCSVAYYLYQQFVIQNKNNDWHAPSLREVGIFSFVYAIINSVLHHAAFPFLLKLESFSISSLLKN